MKKNITIFCVVAGLILLSNTTFAQSVNSTASGQFSLQGMLTNTSGTPIADGQHSLTANVYSSAGQLVFTETDNVTTAKGLFSTMIGANGTGGATLHVAADSGYQLGIAVDGQAELAPRLSLASALSALTSKVAANANAVNGFTVATGNSAKANSLVVLNTAGKLDSSLLQGSLVTSINGMTGPVNIRGGGNLGVSTNGDTVNLSFTGSGGGLNLPFTQTLNLASGTGLSLTNTLGGSAATFANTGLGSAVNVTSMTGSAIMASSTGSVSGGATIDVSNTGGTAINAVGTSTSNAVLTLKNLSSNASAQILSAANSAGTTVLGVAANGQTTVNSSVADALKVTSAAGAAINATTTASADAALKVQNLSSSSGANLISALNSTGSSVLTVAGNGQTTVNSTVDGALNVTTTTGNALALNGGLKITGGAVGTGTVTMGQLQTTITNALAKTNSIILITVNAAGAAAVPLQVASQANGSFTVSAITSLLALTGNVNFSYLIINQ